MLAITKMSRKKQIRLMAVVTVAALAAAALAGCSSSSSAAAGEVTITLSGPNQFTSDTKTFGPAWDQLVAKFEKDNPNITLKTNVLPLSSWAQTSAAQLTAGTAPELIFNQTTHTPDQVVSLDSYMKNKNPFSSTGNPWIEGFNGKYFAGPNGLGKNLAGHYESIPFNLVSVGIYYNKDILSKVGVAASSLSTFDGFTKACVAIKKAGYAPLATDSGNLPVGFTVTALGSMLLDTELTKINQFASDGTPGTNTPVTVKSVAHAYLSGELNIQTDSGFAETLKVLKKFYDNCATPNWSGIQSQGSFTGGTDFPGGKAAMAWGTNFASTSLATADFKYGTLPFPEVSTSDSKVATGKPAQFGVNNGGTAYMIPAYIKGKQRDAAITFLQYMSSPKVQTWLDKTGGIPAITALKAPPGLDAMNSGPWATLSLFGQSGGLFGTPAAIAAQNKYEGYLLGSSTLSNALAKFQSDAVAWSKEAVAQGKWTEDWATK
jgi:ABC-type glycerol-3-phosphate transport system substrate-binding protein